MSNVPARATPVVSSLSLSLNDELFCVFDEFVKFLVLFMIFLGTKNKTDIL